MITQEQLEKYSCTFQKFFVYLQISTTLTPQQKNFYVQQMMIISEIHNESKFRKQMILWCPA